jgi:hypothetical protein
MNLWLKSALFAGQDRNGFMWGTILSLGWFWVRPSGYHIVYGGQDGNINYENPLAIMAFAEHVYIPDQVLPPNTIWHYIRRKVALCGIKSKDSPVCIVRIDVNGEMMLDAPNRPLSLTVAPLASGRFLLRWRYTPIDEEITPTEFHIYIDYGGGFDFDSPTAIIEYGFGGRGEFRWTSDTYSHNQRCKFCVRAYAEDNGETRNTDYASAVADHLGPDVITGIYATLEQL